MELILNGEPLHSEARTLHDLLLQRGIDAAGVAAAIDGNFVPRDHYEELVLHPGMRVEILAPMQGG